MRHGEVATSSIFRRIEILSRRIGDDNTRARIPCCQFQSISLHQSEIWRRVYIDAHTHSWKPFAMWTRLGAGSHRKFNRFAKARKALARLSWGGLTDSTEGARASHAVVVQARQGKLCWKEANVLEKFHIWSGLSFLDDFFTQHHDERHQTCAIT